MRKFRRHRADGPRSAARSEVLHQVHEAHVGFAQQVALGTRNVVEEEPRPSEDLLPIF
jgi:hypothetical protein